MPPPEVPQAAAGAAPDVPQAAAGAAVEALGELLSTLGVDHLEAALALAPVALKAVELLQQLRQERAALAREQSEIAQARAALARERAALAREQSEARASPGLEALTLDETGRLILPRRITYAWCCAFGAARPEVQKQLSHQRRSQYKRVAGLPLDMGQALDSAGIAFNSIRFVAYGVDAQQQRARLDQILRGERPKRAPREERRRPPSKRRARGRPPGSKSKPGSRSP